MRIDHTHSHVHPQRMRRTVATLFGSTCLKCRRRALFSYLHQKRQRPLTTVKLLQKAFLRRPEKESAIGTLLSSSNASPRRHAQKSLAATHSLMQSSSLEYNSEVESGETATPDTERSMDWHDDSDTSSTTSPAGEHTMSTQMGNNISWRKSEPEVGFRLDKLPSPAYFNSPSAKVASGDLAQQQDSHKHIASPKSRQSSQLASHTHTRYNEWQTKSGKPLQRGLINPSAWCYRRSLLQLLFASPQFYNVMVSPKMEQHICNGVCVTCALKSAVESYHGASTQQLNLDIRRLDEAILKTGRESSPAWRANNKHIQDDAHHFLLYILGIVEASKCFK